MTTQHIDEAHRHLVDALQAFLIDTAQPGTLQGLASELESVITGADDLAMALEAASDRDAPEEYAGWA